MRAQSLCGLTAQAPSSAIKIGFARWLLPLGSPYWPPRPKPSDPPGLVSSISPLNPSFLRYSPVEKAGLALSRLSLRSNQLHRRRSNSVGQALRGSVTSTESTPTGRRLIARGLVPEAIPSVSPNHVSYCFFFPHLCPSFVVFLSLPFNPWNISPGVLSFPGGILAFTPLREIQLKVALYIQSLTIRFSNLRNTTSTALARIYKLTS